MGTSRRQARLTGTVFDDARPQPRVASALQLMDGECKLSQVAAQRSDFGTPPANRFVVILGVENLQCLHDLEPLLKCLRDDGSHRNLHNDALTRIGALRCQSRLQALFV